MSNEITSEQIRAMADALPDMFRDDIHQSYLPMAQNMLRTLASEREQSPAVADRVISDRQHIVQLGANDTHDLREWLKQPNGGFYRHRLGIEVVEGGGLLVRTDPFKAGEQSPAVDQAAMVARLRELVDILNHEAKMCRQTADFGQAGGCEDAAEKIVEILSTEPAETIQE